MSRLYERASLTLAQLYSNTEVVLPTTVDRSQVDNYTWQGYQYRHDPRFKVVQTTVVSHSRESDRYYKTVIDYIGVPEGETPSYSETPVRVSCSCPAYYFYFSKWNVDSGAHARGRMKPYVPVINPKRKVGPLNPRHLAGCCHHLLAFAQWQLDSGVIRP